MARPVRWWVKVLFVVLACVAVVIVVLPGLGLVVLIALVARGEPGGELPERSAPRTVAVGAAFTIDELEVRSGWRLAGDTTLDASTVVGLRTGPGGVAYGVRVEFEFGDGDLALISCYPGHGAEPGPDGTPLECDNSSTLVPATAEVVVTTIR